jgi:hypothetical protein
MKSNKQTKKNSKDIILTTPLPTSKYSCGRLRGERKSFRIDNIG